MSDRHIEAMRRAGYAIVVISAQDIQSCGPHDLNDEPIITHKQAKDWLSEHREDVEEVILGDYWTDQIGPLLNLYPIPEAERANA